MNTRITVAAAVAVVSSALFAQDSVVTIAEPITNRLFDFHYILASNTVSRCAVLLVDDAVKKLREQGDMANLVKKLVSSGDVCAVVGHQWESTPHVTLEYRESGEYPQHRMCAICGKVETKEPGAWK